MRKRRKAPPNQQNRKLADELAEGLTRSPVRGALSRPRNASLRAMTDSSFQTLHSNGGARVIFRGVTEKKLRVNGPIRRQFRQINHHFRLDFRQDE